jgi:hypothetical protein
MQSECNNQQIQPNSTTAQQRQNDNNKNNNQAQHLGTARAMALCSVWFGEVELPFKR